MARSLCSIIALLAVAHICSADEAALMFSAGFSSDMVLQRSPAKSAVYGLVQAKAGAKVEVTVSGKESYTVQVNFGSF
jgi:hypothetical protein